MKKIIKERLYTQAWGNTKFKDKNVTIVGSGCTAITMAPSIIKEAKKLLWFREALLGY